jgi:hypothetical protein
MAIVTVNEPTLTRTVSIDWKELALQVEKRVIAKMWADIERWEDDRSMRAMLLVDAGDGLDVCVHIAEGNWSKAEQKLWHMDTAARDYIYEFIEAVAGQDFVEIARSIG